MKFFCTLTISVVLRVAFAERCCYGTHGTTCSDCESADNICSSGAARCDDCGGQLCQACDDCDDGPSSGPVPHWIDLGESEQRREDEEMRREQQKQLQEQTREREEQEREQQREKHEASREQTRERDEQERERREELNEKAREKARKDADKKFATENLCCYEASCSSCEHAGDLCSTSPARCADCGGTLCAANATTSTPSHGPFAEDDIADAHSSIAYRLQNTSHEGVQELIGQDQRGSNLWLVCGAITATMVSLLAAVSAVRKHHQTQSVHEPLLSDSRESESHA